MKRAKVRKKLKRLVINRERFDVIVKHIDPCEDAELWLRRFKGTPEQVWNKCRRADWMLYLLFKVDYIMFAAVRAHVFQITGHVLSILNEPLSRKLCGSVRETCPYSRLRPLLMEYFKRHCRKS